MSFQSYGAFSDIIKNRDLSANVHLKTLKLETKGTYGTGALAQAQGEITVFAGEVFVSYGEKGASFLDKKITANQESMLLATAMPKQWSAPITLNETLEDLEFYDFLEAQLKKLTPSSPTVVFKLEGAFNDVTWHIVNGKNHEKPQEGEKQILMRKVMIDDKAAQGIIFGFYTFGKQGIFTHPGESYHVHGIFHTKTQAWHVDYFTIKVGTKLFIGF